MRCEEIDVIDLIRYILGLFNMSRQKIDSSQERGPNGIGCVYADREKGGADPAQSIGNSLKFTPTGGEISVSAMVRGTPETIW